jgi:imidazolonepropionase-like amidohydrolase
LKKFFSILARALMGLGLLLGLYIAVGVLYPLSPPEAVAPGDLLLRNARLVDLATGAIHNDTDILVEGGLIVAVGPDLSAPDAEIVDARGRYAIPGLFDMHVHSLRLAPVLTHPLQVAAGVTAVRDMGGCLGEYDSWVACAADKRRWNTDVAAGRMVGPRFDQVTGLAIDGGSEIPSGWDADLGAATAAGARARVEHDAARGIDFLKPYSMLPREGYLALAQAAAETDLYLAGHKPLRVSALEAIDAGQRSFEHAFLFIWECFPGAAAVRETQDLRAVYTHEMRLQMLDEHNAAMCYQLMDAMADRGAAYVPTHTTRKLDAFAKDEPFRNDERLRYVPAPLRTLWLGDADSMAGRTDAAGLESYRRFYEFGIAQTGRAHDRGVQVLAGTDSPDSFAFPGLALHDELGHLAQSGMTPLQVLRAATVAPASFLGLEGEAGVLAVGARADIVLLDADPLADIGNVRRVDTVVLAGAVYDRARLDALLADVESAAGHWSMWPKFAWQALRSPIFRAQAAD